MTYNVYRVKRASRRRAAADRAHGWARQFRLGDPFSKALLLALTLHVDDDGVCWPSIDTLAYDTDLSRQTIRRRLIWLEEIGLIKRVPRSYDRYGSVRKGLLGKRTSDEIQFLFDAEPNVVEACARSSDPANFSSREADRVSPSSLIGVTAKNFSKFNATQKRLDCFVTDVKAARARGNTVQHLADEDFSERQNENDPAVPEETSTPASQLGLKSVRPSVSHPLVVAQPYHCGEGLDSFEPQHKDSPLPPFQGGAASLPDVEVQRSVACSGDEFGSGRDRDHGGATWTPSPPHLSARLSPAWPSALYSDFLSVFGPSKAFGTRWALLASTRPVLGNFRSKGGRPLKSPETSSPDRWAMRTRISAESLSFFSGGRGEG